MLLVEKLVAWESYQLHSVRHVFVVDIYEFNIAFVRKGSFRSHVDNYGQFGTLYQVTYEHFLALYANYRYAFYVGLVDLAYNGIEGVVLK